MRIIGQINDLVGNVERKDLSGLPSQTHTNIVTLAIQLTFSYLANASIVSVYNSCRLVVHEGAARFIEPFRGRDKSMLSE